MFCGVWGKELLWCRSDTADFVDVVLHTYCFVHCCW